MTIEIYNRYLDYISNTDTTRFHGEIYQLDFDAHDYMSDIASRIASDKRFDNKCKQHISERERQLRYSKKIEGELSTTHPLKGMSL